MPSYYVELDQAGGEVITASLASPSLPALACRIETEGGRLRRVLSRRPHPALRGYWRRVSEAEVAAVLRQLAMSLRNGLPLPSAVSMLARDTPNLTLRAILSDVEQSLRVGDMLSNALSVYPRLFSPIYVRLLEAAEAGNSLPEVLLQIADYADLEARARQRIRTALVYPQVVGAVTLALLAVTLVFVVPQFRTLFSELGVQEFALVSRSLFWFSSSLLPISALVLPLLLVGGVWLFRRVDAGAPFQMARWKARLPLIGPLYHQLALLRLTRLLAALVSGGVPLLEALRLAGQGSESPLLQAAMWDAIPHVAEGEALSVACGHAGILPLAFCGQLAAAEATGDLPGALIRLSEWYGERVDYLAARVGAVLEPAFVVLLALMVGWVVLGAFAPLLAVIRALSGG